VLIALVGFSTLLAPVVLLVVVTSCGCSALA
jgi:hypothetical protein